MSTAEILQSPQKLSSQQLRKIKKPIIEKRRRERINESLNQLKTLVLEALNKDESQYNKMEKADILEMTVKHLKGLQSRLSKGLASAQPTLVNRYKTGYKECTEEVTRYLNSVPTVHPQVKDHLGDHLNNCARKFEQCSSNNNTNIDTTKKESIYDLNATQLAAKVVENNNTNTLQGQLINGIQVGLPVNMNSSQSMMLATGPISPIHATQGFVPVIISPNNNLSLMSPVHQHQQQQQPQNHEQHQQQQLQTSPLPGSVIPLYSHASLPNSCRSPSINHSVSTSSTNNHNDKHPQNIYSQQQHSMSNCRSPPMLSSYNSPSSPSMAEDAPMNSHFFPHPEESYVPSPSQKALDFTDNKINHQRDIIYNSNSVIVSPSNYNNATKLQHSWSDYARDLHKYGREQLVQSPNGSDVWRPW